MNVFIENKDHSPVLKPIDISERIRSIDILRGMAVFGILLINIIAFGTPDVFRDLYLKEFSGLVDQLSYYLIFIIARAKGAGMFSFLFGLGLAVMYERAVAKGKAKSFKWVYARRLLALFLIATIHELFIWRGSILPQYALMGIPLLIFVKVKPKVLLTLSIISFLTLPGIIFVKSVMKQTLPPTTQAVSTSKEGVNTMKNKAAIENPSKGGPSSTPSAKAIPPKNGVINSSPTSKEKALSELPVTTAARKVSQYIASPKNIRAKAPPSPPSRQEQFRKVKQIHRDGSYAQQFNIRLSDFVRSITILVLAGWFILGLAFLGMACWRLRFFQEVQKNRAIMSKITRISLVLGLPLTIASYLYRYLVAAQLMSPVTGSLSIFVTTFAYWIAIYCMAIFYLLGITLLLQQEKWQTRLAFFGIVGRAPLSNYIFQNIAGTLIFYSYGLKFYGQVGPFFNLLIAVAIFTIQLCLSVWWLKRYAFGPVEWLWRWISYGRRPSIKLKPESVTEPQFQVTSI